MRLRTLALRALIGSVAIGSLLGIIAILGGSMGETGWKILATSFSISGASALVLASLSAWALPAATLWSRLGVFATLIGLFSLNLGMWTEQNKDGWWQVTFSIIVFGAAGAHGSLLSLARLPPKYQAVRVLALTNLVLLAVGVSAAVWAKHDSDATFKLIAIVAILDVAFTLSIGALDYVNRSSTPHEGGGADICFCPRCGRRVWLPAGEIRCDHCKSAFYIELRKSEDLPSAIVR